MKDSTLKILENNLLKHKDNKRTQRNIEKYGYTYEIEYIPILVERTNEGKLGEVTFPENRLMYMNEND